MLKYKINVYDALQQMGFGTYQAKMSDFLSQDALKKIQVESTALNLKTLDDLCCLLDMQPKDLLQYVETENDTERKKSLKKTKKSLDKVIKS